MDEYNSGMDPEVKRYFKKIIRSFTAGLLWLMAVATAGLFFRLGIVDGAARWYHFLFYGLALISLVFLLRYLYKIWSAPFEHDHPQEL